MRKSLEIFFRYIIFWLVYFWVSKLVFLLLNFKLSAGLDFLEIFKIYYVGAEMDLSMIGYLTVLPGLMIALSFLLSAKQLSLFLRAYTSLILAIVTFLNVMDLALYPYWGTRIGINAFSYLGDIKGALANISLFDGLLLLLVFLVFYLFFIWFFRRFVLRRIKASDLREWYRTPVLLFCTVFLIIPIRGINILPINLSSVSFSTKLYANQASVNFLWHFFNTIERRNSYENPCEYYDSEKAFAIFTESEKQRIHSDTMLINPVNGTPNVLLIVLESFSNKVLGSFGGKYAVCPNLDSLSRESVIFPSFYASGNRSDRGLSALLGGYPSLLEMSVMRFPDKSDKLSLMSCYFNKRNYQSSFYYGGDIDFYNLKSFVLQGEYDEIIDRYGFKRKLRQMSNWGVPDGYLFDRILNDLKKKEEPFFTVAYSLSSHPPYDVPVQMIEGQSNEARYLNSIAYTDSCLGDFIRGFKKTRHWENTLVIITSDHGALDPGPTQIIEPSTYRIPMIWTGGVIKEPGVINILGGQPDLIPTLLGQLNWEIDPHLFGHNLFSSPSYAFYMSETGWGYVSKDEEYFYSQEADKVFNFKQKEIEQSNYDFGRAYLQVLHEDFLSK